jgi:hypothetical protein
MVPLTNLQTPVLVSGPIEISIILLMLLKDRVHKSKVGQKQEIALLSTKIRELMLIFPG